MVPRLRADIWAAAYLRTVRAQGGFAYQVRRGADEAGAILLKIELPDRAFTVMSVGYVDGERTWMRSTGPESVSDADADAYIQRRLKSDPDLWVIEVEDSQGRHFLMEPVEGE